MRGSLRGRREGGGEEGAHALEAGLPVERVEVEAVVASREHDELVADARRFELVVEGADGVEGGERIEVAGEREDGRRLGRAAVGEADRSAA